MMNTEIKAQGNLESVRVTVWRLYSTQSNIQRATAIAKILQEGKIVYSKSIARAALDGIAVLGQA